MAATSLRIDGDAVVAVGTRLSAAAQGSPTSSGVAIVAASPDPVSVAVAAALAARVVGVDAHSASGAVITAARGAHVVASAGAHAEQEAVNVAGLTPGGGSGGPVGVPAAPPRVPVPDVPAVTAPSVGESPASGRVIAGWVHAGPGTSGLHSAARALVGHADRLRATGDQVIAVAGDLVSWWSSQSGAAAGSRVSELGQWFHQHAAHTEAAAAAVLEHAEAFDRAKAAIATPGQFAEVQRRLERAAAANASPASLGRYAPVVAALQTQLSTMNAQAITHYATYRSQSAASTVTGNPLTPPPQPGGAPGDPREDSRARDGVQTVGFHDGPLPESPAPDLGDQNANIVDASPPPPPDSAPGGGRWDIDRRAPYASPATNGPFSDPPWHRDVDPPRVGATSGPQDVVSSPHNGWGVDPEATLREQYRLRLTGEQFTPSPDHLRWVEENGKWYRARWIDYQFDAEHVTTVVPHNGMAGLPSLPIGLNQWTPIDIKDIYGITARNPSLTLYVPDPCGPPLVIKPATPDHPIFTRGR